MIFEFAERNVGHIPGHVGHIIERGLRTEGISPANHLARNVHCRSYLESDWLRVGGNGKAYAKRHEHSFDEGDNYELFI